MLAEVKHGIGEARQPKGAKSSACNFLSAGGEWKGQRENTAPSAYQGGSAHSALPQPPPSRPTLRPDRKDSCNQGQAGCWDVVLGPLVK